MNKIVLVICCAILFVKAEELPLDNWRSQYFLLANDLESVHSSSNSGMFWDGIGETSLFEKSLWPDSARMKSNHWFFEPMVDGGLSSVHPDTQAAEIWKIGMLNSITYRNLLIRQTLDVDKRYEYDDAYPSHKDRAVRGRIEEAFMQVNWKYGFFRLGRMDRNWGPFPDRSLILSSNPYTYDALEWQVHSSLFEFRHLFSAFPTEKSNWDTDGRQINRFFTAHALNLILGKWATIGVFETVLFTRDKGFPDLSYVNPFSIYTVVNTNQESTGNLMLGFQWNIHPLTENISFRGQVLLDDFQVDHKTVTDQEPTHWGMDLGLYWKNPLPLSIKNAVRLDYNYRSRWLYTVPDVNTENGERYTYLTKSLGMAENDGYKVNAAIDMIGNKFWAGTFSGGYESKGSNTTNSRWNDLSHIPGLPFDTLNLPAELRINFGIDAFVYFRNYADLKFGFKNIWVKNANNIGTDKYEYKPTVQVELSVHFSDLIVKLPD